MAKYETMMVTTANLDEEASNALINKFKNLIAASPISRLSWTAFSRSPRAFFAA